MGNGTGVNNNCESRETKIMADDNVMAALENVLQTYKTGGEFSAQRASQLKTQERKYTAGAQQGMVSRGLAGTTVAQSIPAAFEQDVAAPYRTETERLRSGQEMQGLLAKAGFLSADEEREMRERLATAERESRESIAGRQLSAQQSASYQASREARLGREAGAAEAQAGREFAGEQARLDREAAAASQHTGGAGDLDLGIDYGAGTQGSTFGGMSMADLTPAERSTLTPGYYHDEQGYASSKSGDPNDPIEPIAHYSEMMEASPRMAEIRNENMAALLQKLMGGGM
jgi:hypothetical protein